MAKNSALLGLYFLLAFRVVEASSACSGIMHVEEPRVVENQQICTSEYSFDKIDVAYCQTDQGQATLYIYAKSNVGKHVYLKKSLKDDSYYIKPSLFTFGKAECADILIVDHGAEFSYGSMVFVMEKAKATYAGMIDLVANQNGDSIATHIRVIQNDNGEITFSFDSDAYEASPLGVYKKLLKNSFYYKYDKTKGLRINKQ